MAFSILVRKKITKIIWTDHLIFLKNFICYFSDFINTDVWSQKTQKNFMTFDITLNKENCLLNFLWNLKN